MIITLDFQGSPNIGVYALSTRDYVILPPTVQEKVVHRASEVLGVTPICTYIATSTLIGALCVANTHGILVPRTIRRDEYEELKKHGLDVYVLDCTKKTALGTLILANDKGAIVDRRLYREAKKEIKDALDVEVVSGSLAGMPWVGSSAVANNKGAYVHPEAREDEIKLIEEVLKVSAVKGTVNCGVKYVASGIIANDKGALVGFLTTGPELMDISSALGVV